MELNAAPLAPDPPARVLDVGAGTGFLSILLAQQRYVVSALDLSAGMLGRLEEKARVAALEVDIVQADAEDPPVTGFDAVVERHLLWTLPDPEAALEAWHRSAVGGRLLLLESLWGGTGGETTVRLRRAGHAALRRLRGQAPDHHAEYDADLRAQLPLGGGTTPERLVSMVEASSWGPVRAERLWDVEWATRRALPSVLDRLVGVAPRFALVAG